MSFSTLRRLPTRGLVSTLELFYSPTVAPLRFDAERLNSHTPAKFVIEDKLNRQPEDRLQWKFGTHASRNVLPLAVMRNRLARKWNEAMRVALKQHGYECDGRRAATRPGQTRSSGLKGTLNILVYNATGLGESHTFRLRNANAIVQSIIQTSKKPRTIPKP